MITHGIGIIGCGMIAEYHVKAIKEIVGAKVVAAFSRSRDNGEKIARLAGGDCKIYDHLNALLKQPGLDVVSVCTPSGAHREPSVLAARAGKHVIVEKPLEITLRAATTSSAPAKSPERGSARFFRHDSLAPTFC